jgi:methionyl aminopeptidase
MTPQEISAYMKAGRIARKAREYAEGAVREGKTLLSLAEELERLIRDEGGEPAFPVNISVNHEAAHYTPMPGDGKVFKRGDVVKVDLGVHVDGYIADTAITVEVGTYRYEALIEAARSALDAVVRRMRVGVRTSEIGGWIEEEITAQGFRPIANLTGHSLDRYALHAGLSIPNFDDGSRKTVEVGMAFAVEPFSTDGQGWVRNWKPGNIYSVKRARKGEVLGDFGREVIERFKGLPFTPRWLPDTPDRDEMIRRGVKSGFLHAYPVLVERGKGTVAQFEHTFIVTGEGVKVTTL